MLRPRGLQRRTPDNMESNCNRRGLLWEQGGYDFLVSLFVCCFSVLVLVWIGLFWYFFRVSFYIGLELPIKRLFKFEIRLLLAHQTKLSPSSCLICVRLKSRLSKTF